MSFAANIDAFENEFRKRSHKYARLEKEVVPAAGRVLDAVAKLNRCRLPTDENVAGAIKRAVASFEQTSQATKKRCPSCGDGDDSDDDAAADNDVDDMEEVLDWAIEGEFYAWCISTLENKAAYSERTLQLLHDALTVVLFENGDNVDDGNAKRVTRFEDWPEMTTVLVMSILTTMPISVTDADDLRRMIKRIIAVVARNPGKYDGVDVVKQTNEEFAKFFTRVLTHADRILA